MSPMIEELNNTYRYIENVQQKAPIILEKIKNQDISQGDLSKYQEDLREVNKLQTNLRTKTETILKTLTSSEIFHAYEMVCPLFRIIIGVHMTLNFKAVFMPTMINAVKFDYDGAYHFLGHIWKNIEDSETSDFVEILDVALNSQYDAMIEEAFSIIISGSFIQFIPKIEQIATSKLGRISFYAERTIEKIKKI